MLHEFVRESDGVIEHALFHTQIDNTVVVSFDLMREMLMSLGFKPLDTVSGDVLESSHEAVSSPTDNPG
jgi:hypothetical protein